MAEAGLFLLIARILILILPMRYWRATLGHPENGMPRPATTGTRPTSIATAIRRAAARFPFPLRCLPRAMAAQWMLRRRGEASILVFGIWAGEPAADFDPLHAWVETGGIILIGAEGARQYRRGLSLIQP